MNEQTKLLAMVDLARHSLESPTMLPKKTLLAARALAQDLGNRCWFNAGWHAANPNGELKGSASTPNLFAELVPLVDLLQHRQKPQRGRGAPVKDEISRTDFLVIREYLTNRTGRSLASVIDDHIRKGSALNKTKTTASHVKRIERIIKKLQKVHVPNVVPFRPRKKVTDGNPPPN